MNERFPDKGSPYAQEGTIAHRVCELKLKAELSVDSPDWDWNIQNANRYVEDAVEKGFCDQDMCDYADEYVNFIISRTVDYPDSDVMVEQQVDIGEYIAGCFGTADCVIAREGSVSVIDFKYGKHVPVSATENTQLKLYALGVIAMYDAIYDFDDVELVIVQPRCGGTNSWTTKKEDLIGWAENFVRPNAKLALSGRGLCKKGDWCKFCKAKAVCREYGEQYDVPDDYLLKPAELSDEEIAERLARLDDVKAYADAVKEYALDQCLTGPGIPGYKAVEGRSTRVWTDMDAAFRRANEAGYPDEVLYERVPLTLARVEKLMGKKRFSEALGLCVYKTKGKPTLVKSSDKREPYQENSAEDDFKGIETT